MTQDTALSHEPEIAAMAAISTALQQLDDAGRQRVLQWASGRFGLDLGAGRLPGRGQDMNGKRRPADGVDGDPEDVHEDMDLASFFDRADPQTDADKVLAVGAWFQIQGSETIEGFAINKELKQLGHGVSNITNAFNSLINRSPRLAMQVRKSGSTRQARKKYKITNEGMKRVRHMLGGGDADDA